MKYGSTVEKNSVLDILMWQKLEDDMLSES